MILNQHCFYSHFSLSSTFVISTTESSWAEVMFCLLVQWLRPLARWQTYTGLDMRAALSRHLFTSLSSVAVTTSQQQRHQIGIKRYFQIMLMLFAHTGDVTSVFFFNYIFLFLMICKKSSCLQVAGAVCASEIALWSVFFYWFSRIFSVLRKNMYI